MKTSQLIPAWLLYLFAPLVALAQNAPSRGNELVLRSSALWLWVAMLVVAAVAFAIVSFRLSRRRQPPHPPGTP
jgi:tellurite resistance protein TehA-like permease